MAQHDDQRVVKKQQVGTYEVSTVFLGINHNFNPTGPAIVWETMVFGGDKGIFQHRQNRCSGSREQAQAMHARMVTKVREFLNSKTKPNESAV